MAQQVQLNVKIGGSKISPVSYCSINQRIDWHHSFEILLPTESLSKNFSTILDQAREFIGQKIELAFKVIRPKETNIQNEFYGIVTEVNINRRNQGDKEILIRGYSPTILLDERANCHSYSERSLEDIVLDLHNQIPHNDLKINIYPAFKDEIPYIVQYKESNFHFLNRIADKYGN